MKKIFYTICLAFLFFAIGCTANVEKTHTISKTYTISFNEKGGSDVDDIVLKHGDEIVLPSCEKGHSRTVWRRTGYEHQFRRDATGVWRRFQRKDTGNNGVQKRR